MGMNDSFIYDCIKFVTGDKVTCTIDGTEIIDAKIYVCSKEELKNSELVNIDLCVTGAYICQNDLTGSIGPNLLGYDRSWIFSITTNNKLTEGVKDLKHTKYFFKDELAKIVQSSFPNT
jgi:hypothetical protein